MATQPTLSHVSTEAAQRVAEQFIADNLGDQIGVGMPWRVVSSFRSAWVVPLVLTSPGYGVVGIVSAVIIDEELGIISAWTPLDEIAQTAERLAQQQLAERQAAWERVQVKALV